MEIIQVSATSPTSAVAQAISSVVYEYHCAEVQAIGAEAVHRAEQALTLGIPALAIFPGSDAPGKILRVALPSRFSASVTRSIMRT